MTNQTYGWKERLSFFFFGTHLKSALTNLTAHAFKNI